MGNQRDSLGDRMKRYEYVSRNYLTRRVPVIIRIDGKAFHTFEKAFRPCSYVCHAGNHAFPVCQHSGLRLRIHAV